MRKLHLSLKVKLEAITIILNILSDVHIGALVRSGEDYLTTEKPKLLQPIDQPNKKVSLIFNTACFVVLYLSQQINVVLYIMILVVFNPVIAVGAVKLFYVL